MADASGAAHAITRALGVDDVDAALDSGLMDAAPCPACTVECQANTQRARDERIAAFAARHRFDARNARLARRAQEAAARRAAPRNTPPIDAAITPAPALPPAAADALARAKARAALRRGA